jgi:hypothetical protein
MSNDLHNLPTNPVNTFASRSEEDGDVEVNISSAPTETRMTEINVRRGEFIFICLQKMARMEKNQSVFRSCLLYEMTVTELSFLRKTASHLCLIFKSQCN